MEVREILEAFGITVGSGIAVCSAVGVVALMGIGCVYFCTDSNEEPFSPHAETSEI